MAKKNETVEMEKIIDYLNKKADKKYRYTPKHFIFIKARFKEGFIFDDFKTAIDNKCEEWNNTNMEKYLRPETLFGNKMDGYVNQKNIKRKVDDTPTDEEKREAELCKQIIKTNVDDMYLSIYEKKLRKYEDKYGSLED